MLDECPFPEEVAGQFAELRAPVEPDALIVVLVRELRVMRLKPLAPRALASGETFDFDRPLAPPITDGFRGDITLPQAILRIRK
jgi:hypothetical protein